MIFDVSYKNFVMMCSMALFEYSMNHKNDAPDLAEYARLLSDGLDNVIDKLTQEE